MLVDLPDAPTDIHSEVYTEWKGLDENTPTLSIPTEEEICTRIVGGMNEDCVEALSDGEDGAEDNGVKPPTHKQMADAMLVLRRGVQRYGNNFEFQYKNEDYIKTMLINTKRQTVIDDSFKK